MVVDGEEGWDVVCWKKKADPMELKRLWKEVQRVCAEIVFAT